MLKSSLLGTVKLTKNADPDKYSYSRYGISFDIHGTFSLRNGGFGKNIVIFGANTGWFVHVDHRRDVLILGKGPTQRLDNTALNAEPQYSINFTKQGKKFCLSLHYNESNSYLFVNAVKMHQLKAKDSKLNARPVCLGNISEDFAVDNMKQTGLNRYVYHFSLIIEALMLIIFSIFIKV